MKTDKEKNRWLRLEYVDIFRGLALLFMVYAHIFDGLSASSIYSSKPYYIAEINSATLTPPPLLFTFVSGISVFLLIKKRGALSNLTKMQTFIEATKRYARYVIISLPFTVIMWNISIYLQWEEAIQGIGLSAIFLAFILIVFFKDKKMNFSKFSYVFLIFLIVIISLLRVILSQVIGYFGLFSDFPIKASIGNASMISVLGSTLLNALFRGWFSVMNLVPMMIGGVIMINLMNSKSHKNAPILFGIAFLLFSFLLHFSGHMIDYYNKSFAFTFFAIGESALICSFAYLAYVKFKERVLAKKIFGFLSFFGEMSFFVYIAHFLLILKVLEIAKLKDLLPDIYAAVITVPLVISMYLFARFYNERFRARLPGFLRL